MSLDDAPALTDTPAALTAAADLLSSAPRIAVDTEFLRVSTFYPVLGLLQLGTDSQHWLVDPLALSDLSPLAPLFSATGPVKILHACSEDLEVLQAVFGSALGPIHDTQILLAFAGEGLQLGYAASVAKVLDVTLEKDAARSDWLQRPLSAIQRRYAALDVVYLPALYDAVRASLEAKGTWAWAVAESEAVCRPPQPQPDDALWRSHSQAWRLGPQQRAALQAITAWREDTARRRNVPRGFLLKPSTIFALAQSLPTRSEQLMQLPDVHPRTVRQDGSVWLSLVAEAKARAPEACPAPVDAPLPREAQALMTALRGAIDPVAQAHQVPMDVLWRKRLADRVVAAVLATGAVESVADVISDWRAPLLVTPVMSVLHEHQSLWRPWRSASGQSASMSL